MALEDACSSAQTSTIIKATQNPEKTINSLQLPFPNWLTWFCSVQIPSITMVCLVKAFETMVGGILRNTSKHQNSGIIEVVPDQV